VTHPIQTTELHCDDLACREAVGVFPDKVSLEQAIDELLLEGFDRRELSLLASETSAQSKLGLTRKSPEELADSPRAHRTDYFCPEALGGAEGALVGGFTYLPATGALWVASAFGATTIVTTVATVATGGTGLLVGAGLAYWLARRHSSHLQEQIDQGGLLLWVRTRTPELEAKALRTLEKFNAHNAHVHDASRLEV
jgi:hypothetical protein